MVACTKMELCICLDGGKGRLIYECFFFFVVVVVVVICLHKYIIYRTDKFVVKTGSNPELL